MKITFYSILSVIAFTTTVYADLSYFSKPQADQIFSPGSAIEFQIDDMPNEDDAVLRANLYTEKGRFVSLVREWKSEDIPESCSFFWQIPGNFTAGRYFVELDQTATEKDNMNCKDDKDHDDGEEEEEDDEDEDEDEDEDDDDDNDKEEDGERVMSHVFVIQASVTPTSNVTGTTTGTTTSSTTRTSSSSKTGGHRPSDDTNERTSKGTSEKTSETTSSKTVPFRTVDDSMYDNTFDTARIPLLAKLASTSKSKSSSRMTTMTSSRKKIVDKRTAQPNHSLRRRFY